MKLIDYVYMFFYCVVCLFGAHIVVDYFNITDTVFVGFMGGIVYVNLCHFTPQTEMEIEVISVWYNEEFLSRFFLKHYWWANKIRILVDVDTTDHTRGIIDLYRNVTWEPFVMPDGLDDALKADAVTAAYRESKANWVLLVDADEFLFERNGFVPSFLARQTNDVVGVRFYEVYRHVTDEDLDFNRPALKQRRHGDQDNILPGVCCGIYKACVARTGQNLSWFPGCHIAFNERGTNELNYSPELLYGVHWRHADPCFCVDRLVKGRYGRQSKANDEKYHLPRLTSEDVLAECKMHENDPEVI